MKEFTHEIVDDETGEKQELHVCLSAEGIFIRPTGYGDSCSADGDGASIMIEKFAGEMRVNVWADINKHDPTHEISIEGAKLTKRRG